MKTSLNKYSIILLVIFVTLSCSKENNQITVPEPTTQELILGTWSVDSAITDINAFIFEQGEATVTFRQDSVMVFQNNGTQTFIPLGESQRIYYIDKFCSTSGDTLCPDDEKIELLVTYITENVFNTIRFEDNNNALIFGVNYADAGDYYCTKINDNL